MSHHPPEHTTVNLHPGEEVVKGDHTLDHTHLKDGSVIPQVELCIINEHGDGVPITLADVEKTAKTIAIRLRHGKPCKGGFFIHSEGHDFSNVRTVDELWQVENWFKAMAAVLNDRSVHRAETYWHAPDGHQEAVEGAIEVSLHNDTAFTLTHDHKAQVNIKQLRVHIKEFSEILLEHGKTVLALTAAVGNEIKQEQAHHEHHVDDAANFEEMMKYFPHRLESHMDHLRDAMQKFIK